jgi:hypothetical protein
LILLFFFWLHGSFWFCMRLLLFFYRLLACFCSVCVTCSSGAVCSLVGASGCCCWISIFWWAISFSRCLSCSSIFYGWSFLRFLTDYNFPRDPTIQGARAKRISPFSCVEVWAILLPANYCRARRKWSAIYMYHGFVLVPSMY